MSEVTTLIETDARSVPVSEAQTRKWHSVLFSTLVPLSYYAGNWRCDDSAKPCLGVNVEVGTVKGSHFPNVPAEMKNWGSKIGKMIIELDLRWALLAPPQRTMVLITVISESVGLFIQIHPFINGNGRISRLLWFNFLRRYNLPPHARVHPRPPPPYNDIMRAAMAGDLRPFQLYLLRALAEPKARNQLSSNVAPSTPQP
jgi:fido (protein-threonine AMPylation protein)